MSPSKLPSTLHSMALVTRTRHPFWMSLIISFSLMRKQDTQVRCPSSQTAALWTSLWPGAKSMACPDPMLSFPSLWPCFIFLHFLSLPPTFWEDTLLQELSFTYWKLLVLFWEGLMFITDFKNQDIVTYKNLIPCRDVWQTWTCICSMFLKNEMAVVGPQCLTQDRNLFLSHVLGSVGSSPQGHQGPALVDGPTICIPWCSLVFSCAFWLPVF